MRNRTITASICVALLWTDARCEAAGAASTATPSAVTDPDVQKGIRAAEEGDYDLAIFVLDAAARRLAADRSRVTELSLAYLHLGIAYVAKGHEAAARAQFREALKGARDLNLSPERFPPRVIDLFESAREEARRERPPETPASSGSPGKSKLPLFVIGGVGVAAGGAAIALGSGGGSADTSPPPDSSPASLTPPPSSSATQTQSFSGNIAGNENLSFPVAAGGPGTLEAKVSWTNAEAALAMDLHVVGAGHIAATSSRTSNTSAMLTLAVAPQSYSIQVLHRGGCGSTGHCSTAFTLVVNHP